MRDMVSNVWSLNVLRERKKLDLQAGLVGMQAITGNAS